MKFSGDTGEKKSSVNTASPAVADIVVCVEVYEMPVCSARCTLSTSFGRPNRAHVASPTRASTGQVRDCPFQNCTCALVISEVSFPGSHASVVVNFGHNLADRIALPERYGLLTA